ncbi:hypothetical protein Scep_030656 [Stephania cephalantha]|uniref:Uncharacterized protein n=1 Tax=Stephania cephalantha TaxID=152367 RepID=A0AAP0E2V7_9MAGN
MSNIVFLKKGVNGENCESKKQNSKSMRDVCKKCRSDPGPRIIKESKRADMMT